MGVLQAYCKDISIHAPPRGATVEPAQSDIRMVISIHAPPRGATSRAFAERLLAVIISIHAPPRGATMSCDKSRRVMTYFNSRPSARGDAFPRWRKKPRWKFQFTPLREGRRFQKSIWRHGLYFNSRPSARGDCRLKTLQHSQHAFQFTPLREGRRQPSTSPPNRASFQFTPLREGRPAS